MKDELNRGCDLVRQERFQEAEILFEKLAAAHSGDLAPLQELVKVAREQKNYALMLERVERILHLDPKFLEARILRRQILARTGAITELRDELGTFIELAERGPLTAIAARQLMRAIQYCSSGSVRIGYLQNLRSLVKDSSEQFPSSSGPFRVLQAEILLAMGDYEDFSEVVKKLADKKPLSKKVIQLTRIAKQCNAPHFPDFSAPKVFGIGLSRTATSSLNDALTLLGFHSIHWFNPHSLTLISQDDFCLFDAFTDIPVSYQFEVLYHTFPNAQFIYTTRSIESWERSVAVHYDNSPGIQCPSELKSPTATQRFNFAAGPIENNLYGRFDSWTEAFLDFDKRVRSFFLAKPPSKFLELSICDGEGWEKLCPFLGHPVPSVPFPNTNQSPAKYRK